MARENATWVRILYGQRQQYTARNEQAAEGSGVTVCDARASAARMPVGPERTRATVRIVRASLSGSPLDSAEQAERL